MSYIKNNSEDVVKIKFRQENGCWQQAQGCAGGLDKILIRRKDNWPAVLHGTATVILEVTRDGFQGKMQKWMKLQESFSRQRAKAGLKRLDKLMSQYYELGSGMCEPPKWVHSVRTTLRKELPMESCNCMTDESFKHETKGRGLGYSVSMPDSNARQKRKIR